MDYPLPVTQLGQVFLIFAIIYITPWLASLFLFINFVLDGRALNKKLKVEHPLKWEEIGKPASPSFEASKSSFELSLFYWLHPIKGIIAFIKFIKFAKSDDHLGDLKLEELKKKFYRSAKILFITIFIILFFQVFIAPFIIAILIPNVLPA